MAIKFIDKDHQYISTDKDDIQWKSVTGVVSSLHEKFNPELQAPKSSKNKKSPYYGIPPDEICAKWNNESSISSELGSWYHNKKELNLIEQGHITRDNGSKTVPVIKSIIIDGIKYAPEQKLKEGIYPEHLMYLKSAGICGQSDLVEVVDNIVDITDYKTNKDLKTEAYVSWDGSRKMMLEPVSHLQDSHLVQYGLQLSLYMYMIIKHNPLFKPGRMTISHVVFAEISRDKFNTRTLRRTDNGDPIIAKWVTYEVPYYKQEVINIINYLSK